MVSAKTKHHVTQEELFVRYRRTPSALSPRQLDQLLRLALRCYVERGLSREQVNQRLFAIAARVERARARFLQTKLKRGQHRQRIEAPKGAAEWGADSRKRR